MIFNFEPKNTAVTLCEEKMKNIALATSCALFLSFSLATLAASTSVIPEIPQGASNFYKSDKVTVKNVSFENLYKMKVAGHLYLPKNADMKKTLPAVIVGHPMGAVKEQSADLYATVMAERGFAALSIDLSFWGESEGQPRNAVSPDIYSDDFSAAVDYLSTVKGIDTTKIGAIGVCGSGSFLISAAKIDPRLKAIVTVSMYNMGAANRNGLNHSQSVEQRKAIIAEAAQQRQAEYHGAAVKYTSGTPHEINEKSNAIEKEFYSFYRTKRGEYTPEGVDPMTTTHPTLSSNVKFMNFYPFNDIETISPRAMLFITGEQAHSIEFSRDAYKRAAEPKELLVVPGANHVDLYDRMDLIPFDKIESFFKENL